MEKLTLVKKTIYVIVHTFLNQFKSVNNLFIKSNDETVNQLLKSNADKAKFQRAIDEVTNTSKETNITLNGRNVTISI